MKPNGRNLDRVTVPDDSASVTVRAASDSPVAGYEMTNLEDNRLIYVSPKALWNPSEVLSIDRVDDSGYLSLKLSDQAIGRLTSKGYHRVAVYVGERFTTLAGLKVRAHAGIVEFADLLPGQAQRLSRIITIAPTVSVSPRLSLVARELIVEAGALVTIDAYVTNVLDLRAFQLAVDVLQDRSAGQQGRMELKEIRVEDERPDYVFAGQTAVDSADDKRGRVLGAMLEGSIATSEGKYLATYVFQASDRAQGSFQFQIRANADTLLRDERSLPVGFEIDAPISVTVGRETVPYEKQ